MKKLKFIHFGDLHLDMPFTSLEYGDFKSTVRRQELLECFDRLLNIAKFEKVDVILISGDLFEHSYVRKSTINHINQSFSKLKEIKIFIAPGNHDPLVTDSYYKSMDWSDNVYIFDDTLTSYYLEANGAFIYGKPFKGFFEKKSLINGFTPVDRRNINLLLIHGTVDMGVGQGEYNPMTSLELDSLGMDYAALGHFHNRIDAAGGRKIIYNPGSPEPLGFDEPGFHGAYLGIISKEDGECEPKLDIRFIETGKRFYKKLDVSVNGLNTNEEILNYIYSLTSDDQMESGLYDIRLKGYTGGCFTPDIKVLQNSLKETTFFSKISDETSEAFDIDSISNEPGLKGLYVRKMLALINSEEDEEKRRLAESALHYGLEALENGEIDLD